MDNDGHDKSLEFSSNWLQYFLEPLLVHPVFQNTLFVVTFDENDRKWDFFSNQIYNVLLGPVAKGTTDDNRYDLYSIMATMRRFWGVGSVDKDASANAFKLQ